MLELSALLHNLTATVANVLFVAVCIFVFAREMYKKK